MQSSSSYEKRTRIDKNVVEWNVEVCPNSGPISRERIATTRKSMSGDFEPTAHYETRIGLIFKSTRKDNAHECLRI